MSLYQKIKSAITVRQVGEVEGAMSGLAIAVAGVLTAVLCPIFAALL